MTATEVVTKALAILGAIDNCGCDHCIDLLRKGGLAAHQQTTAAIPGTNQDGYREYSS